MTVNGWNNQKMLLTLWHEGSHEKNSVNCSMNKTSWLVNYSQTENSSFFSNVKIFERKFEQQQFFYLSSLLFLSYYSSQNMWNGLQKEGWERFMVAFLWYKCGLFVKSLNTFAVSKSTLLFYIIETMHTSWIELFPKRYIPQEGGQYQFSLISKKTRA